jgi:hypothetical protein
MRFLSREQFQENLRTKMASEAKKGRIAIKKVSAGVPGEKHFASRLGVFQTHSSPKRNVPNLE